MKEYSYYSDWAPYAYREETKKFISDKRLIDNYCVCTEPGRRYRSGSGLPLLYNKKDNKIYCLCDDSHTLVEGESGNKKSRCVVRNMIVTAALNGDSVIVTDHKGELYGDKKIVGLLHDYNYAVKVLDFRSFDKDGYNILKQPLLLARKGNISEAVEIISRVLSCLIDEKLTNDHFWLDSSEALLTASAEVLLMALAEKPSLAEAEKYANLASWFSFISSDTENLLKISKIAASRFPKDSIHNPAATMEKIYRNPDRTLACIISQTVALIKELTSNAKLTKMLSVSTFDITLSYKKPMAVFIIVPDETNAYDRISGFVIDTLYSELIKEHTAKYMGRTEPENKIHFICDEFCNIHISDMSAKISASRSRNILFTLICQSNKQLRTAYEADADTIIGNCRNFLFLGSSDQSILQDVSKMTGTTKITEDGREEWLISSDDLRKMKKEREYKDALLVRENILYPARLVDYEQYRFLDKYKHITFNKRYPKTELKVYTPEELYEDILRGYVTFAHSRKLA